MRVICHCLVPGDPVFYNCCGYYDTKCGGRMIEKSKWHNFKTRSK